jgi:hypothetical protein
VSAPTLAQQLAHAHATALLSSHMIDPREVTVKGLTEEGYETMVFDIHGQRIFDIHDPENVGLHTVPHTWPEGFPVQEFLDAVRKWQGAQL